LLFPKWRIVELKSNNKKGVPFPFDCTSTMRLHLDRLANIEGISINQLGSLALAEKIARLDQHPPSAKAHRESALGETPPKGSRRR
jgi:hypothetical protein